MAEKAFDRSERDFGNKYPKATEKLAKDRDELLSFYDFPAGKIGAESVDLDGLGLPASLPALSFKMV